MLTNGILVPSPFPLLPFAENLQKPSSYELWGRVLALKKIIASYFHNPVTHEIHYLQTLQVIFSVFCNNHFIIHTLPSYCRELPPHLSTSAALHTPAFFQLLQQFMFCQCHIWFALFISKGKSFTANSCAKSLPLYRLPYLLYLFIRVTKQ